MSFDSLTLETGGYLTLENGVSHLLLEIFPVYTSRGGGSARIRKPWKRTRDFTNWSPNPVKDVFGRPELIPVDSSVIASIAHNPVAHTLQIGFKHEGQSPDSYRYHGVSRKTATKIMTAAKSPVRSVGTAVNKVIIGKHSFTKIK